jgi:hypothetical protein
MLYALRTNAHTATLLYGRDREQPQYLLDIFQIDRNHDSAVERCGLPPGQKKPTICSDCSAQFTRPLDITSPVRSVCNGQFSAAHDLKTARPRIFSSYKQAHDANSCYQIGPMHNASTAGTMIIRPKPVMSARKPV